MNKFYLEMYLDRKIALNVDEKGRIEFVLKDALLLTKASGLKSKKSRKVAKRFKKIIHRLIRLGISQEKSSGGRRES